MTPAIVLQRLRQLQPTTFRRQGDVYGQFEASFAALLSRYTTSQDDTTAQEGILTSGAKWLDTYGLMYGIPRFADEDSADYLSRIQETLVSARGTPVAIETYLQLITGVTTAVSEDTTDCRWTASFGGPLSAALKTRVNKGVNFVRPAGVPFSFSFNAGGLYASTINYLGRSRVTGAYLISSGSGAKPDISANTNNSLPTLPTDYLTDPTLNPSL